MGLQRVHIMLTDRQLDRLRDESERTDVSMGELVRRALDAAYRPNLPRRLFGWEVSAAVWKRPDPALVGRRVGTKI